MSGHAPPALTVATVRADLEKAAKGDPAGLPTVRRMLADPKFVADFGGDLARTAENAVLDQTAGTNLVFREAVRAKAAALRADLAGPAASALEAIVADRVVANWVQVHYAEAVLAQATGWTLAPSDAWQRRIDRAHNRLLSAARTLAAVRRIAMPAVLARITDATGPATRPELGQPERASSNARVLSPAAPDG